MIGASFGPVCGAMLADFLLSGGKWSGPRAGFNPAGWISWIVGFAVGAFNLVVDLLLKCELEWVTNACPNLVDYWHYVPMPPVTAFVVGFALYLVLSVLGLRTRKAGHARPGGLEVVFLLKTTCRRRLQTPISPNIRRRNSASGDASYNKITAA